MLVVFVVVVLVGRKIFAIGDLVYSVHAIRFALLDGTIFRSHFHICLSALAVHGDIAGIVEAHAAKVGIGNRRGDANVGGDDHQILPTARRRVQHGSAVKFRTAPYGER